MTTSDDPPTVVFAGDYAEAVFLKTLIESAGIETTLDGPPIRRGAMSQSKLYVRQADFEHARDLVAHFKTHGHRTKA